jgi:hypothetical protein
MWEFIIVMGKFGWDAEYFFEKMSECSFDGGYVLAVNNWGSKEEEREPFVKADAPGTCPGARKDWTACLKE